jgi:signal transduction histidine kinase
MPPDPAHRGRLQHGVSSAVAWAGRHPVLADLAVPLVLAAATVGPAGGRAGAITSWWWLAAAGCIIPLAWRRGHPVIVFGGVLAAATAITVADIPPLALTATAALLIALYTVAAHMPLRHALVAAGAFEAWGVPTLVRWSPSAAILPGTLLLTGTAVASVMTGVNLRTRRAYLAALEDRAARLEKEQDQQAQLAVATERTRIAREVHDIVTHNLSVMVALADGAAAAAPTSSVRASQAMEQVAATGRQAIGEMRRLVDTLRIDEAGADHHPAPGIGQLDDLLTQARSTGLPARLVVEGRPHRLTQGAQLAVYRIVQESLTNIRKHAHAVTGATVRLKHTSEGIEVCITDDGQPAGRAEPAAGHGITGMRERAAAYDGTVEAGPCAGGGWRVRARLNAGRSEGP